MRDKGYPFAEEPADEAPSSDGSDEAEEPVISIFQIADESGIDFNETEPGGTANQD